jgi:hypothetical protein
LKSIGASAFYGCSSLKSIKTPATVTSIGNQAFYNCSALTSITLPESLSSIGKYAFRYCSNLEHVYFNGPPPTSVGSNPFQYVKSGCRGYYRFQYK